MSLVLSFFFIYCYFSLSGADYVAPEALFNIPHIEFPRAIVSGQNFRALGDRYGLTSDYRCSSLIGPNCASQDDLNAVGESTYFAETKEVPDVRLQVIIGKPGQSHKDIIDEIREEGEEFDPDTLSEFWLDGGNMAGESAQVSEALGNMDPEVVGKIADQVAEIVGINDKEAFKHRVFSKISSLLTTGDYDFLEDEFNLASSLGQTGKLDDDVDEDEYEDVELDEND